jgi:hypothetical protein
VLEADSQAIHLEMVQKEQRDKMTKRLYDRSLENYCEWWEQQQVKIVASDANWIAILAFPITAAKVTMFLKYESTREKRVYFPLPCGVSNTDCSCFC